jgi:sarcosine oxidase subunit gamma
MVDQLSPLEPVLRSGRYGHLADGPGVSIGETQPGSIVQLAAWQDQEKAIIKLVKQVAGLALPDGAGGGVAAKNKAAFGFAPGRFLIVSDEEGLAEKFTQAVGAAIGTVTDLSHGRTAIRIAGPKSEWVLAKFFAIDFSAPAFPIGSGISTVHHDLFTQIQRVGPDQFELYVFRSFARSFWHSLCIASEEVGYEIT